jgi:NAD(P)-dependent dehydrogenase (short-subunit alcohol dehydrogenase family)
MTIQNTAFHLHEKTILVTGASSGIGRQVAISCSQMGARVVINGRNEERLQETFSQLEGSHHQIIVADLCSEESREGLVKNVPQLDGLVHCAGGVKPFPIKFLNQAHIDDMLVVNFNAPVLLTASLLRLKKLNKASSLVYLSSISGEHPPKGGSMYGAAKGGLETFVIVLAREIYPQGMRANCISPGMVKTPLYDSAEAAISKQEMDKHMEGYPLGVGFPEDVAHAAIYLLSPASRWVTGINLTLDGGFLIGA